MRAFGHDTLHANRAGYSMISRCVQATACLGKTKQPIKPYFASNDYQHIKQHLLQGKTIGDLPDFSPIC
ncbi:hypothetical protein [Testudinibacter sp. TR-2022]|uniref:hypothetical protein n=2 Tax=Testudinibacter sp. TR-2022 TaxID=2585029 RepID=UPI00111B57D2|nr:hypothetical protein [Testudinibacter sp. TR-2022]